LADSEQCEHYDVIFIWTNQLVCMTGKSEAGRDKWFHILVLGLTIPSSEAMDPDDW